MSDPFCAQCGMEIEAHNCLKPPSKRKPPAPDLAKSNRLFLALWHHEIGVFPINKKSELWAEIRAYATALGAIDPLEARRGDAS